MINFMQMMGRQLDPVGRLMGVPVYQSHWLPEFSRKRIRAHTRKHWDRTGSYHRRIDKKWAKRYGFSEERQVLRTPQGLFMHPGTWAALKLEMDKQFNMRPDPRGVVDALEDAVTYGRHVQLRSTFGFKAVLNPAVGAAIINTGVC